MRSVEADPFYTDNHTYTLGDVAIAAPNDGFYRVVYSTTVALRNTVARSLID